MREYYYTKILGTIVGIVTIIMTIGMVGWYLFGVGLSNALNGSQSSPNPVMFIYSFLLFIAGLVTIIGAFKLRYRAWQLGYTLWLLLTGVTLVVVFFISFGAIGTTYEILILVVGISYLVISYFTYKRK